MLTIEQTIEGAKIVKFHLSFDEAVYLNDLINSYGSKSPFSDMLLSIGKGLTAGISKKDYLPGLIMTWDKLKINVLYYFLESIKNQEPIEKILETISKQL